ncbi:unnamed protein product [Lactuca saligna]|uniref:Uncharacterized protein n=1 Tax=Lactuca saligna TaxID=75948 RepID=A0AA36A5Y1_LACSI|nr:unnamed protein product [Lactuca saligna]
MIDRRTRAFDESDITTTAPASVASSPSSSTFLSPFYPDNNINATSSSPNYFSSSSSRNTRKKVTSIEEEPEAMDSPGPDRGLKVEGSVVHIMKALASHPAVDQSLIEDKSLQLLFEMVANGSLILFSRYKEFLVPLHNIQLHMHAMQILGLLMYNDNRSTTKYIRRHQLIKILLIVVKDFKPETGDPVYALGIVNLLLECIELSYRPATSSKHRIVKPGSPPHESNYCCPPETRAARRQDI